MYRLKKATAPPPRGTGLTEAVRGMPVSEHLAIDVPYGTNARSKRATLYQLAKRLGYVLHVHDNGTCLQVWRRK